MGACRYVGRVGGLAVGLGVGAAVLGGTAAAWAEDGADRADAAAAPGRSATAHTDSAKSPEGPARQSRGELRTRPPAGAPAGRSDSAPRPAASAPVRPVSRGAVGPIALAERVSEQAASTPDPTPVPSGVAVTAPAPAPSPVLSPAPSPVAGAPTPVPPVPAPLSAPVLSVPAVAVGTAADGPSAPLTAPLEWTVLAAARRDALTAAGALVQPAAATPVSLIIGPSGVPVPTEFYGENVTELYGLPEPGQILFTPEGLYPITGPKSLPLNVSVDQGIEILSRALDELSTDSPDTPVTVFGYSQSAILGSLLQGGYDDYSISADQQVSFVFVGNEMNPNGGFLSRFPDLNLAALGIPFYGPTPADAFPTTNYALEYDGFADFPRYPLNFLSVLNAGLGIVFVHVKYSDVEYMSPLLPDKIALPVRPGTEDTQRYYFIPTGNLPLLEPLRAIPLVGNPIADLVQPVLKVIVDLGYADPAHGFATGIQPYANELTPFGLFPEVSPLEVLARLGEGIVQGVNDFVADFGPGGSIERELSAIRLPSPQISLPAGGDVIGALQNLISSVADGISFAASSIYAALLPTADIANSILVSLPAYAVNLVLGSIQQMLSGDIIGGLLNAVGLPIAASVGLVTTASLVGALVWANGIATALGISIPG